MRLFQLHQTRSGVQPPLALDPVSHGWRHVDRAEPGDVLVADLAVDTAVFDQADLQPATLAEADEHVVAR